MSKKVHFKSFGWAINDNETYGYQPENLVKKDGCDFEIFNPLAPAQPASGRLGQASVRGGSLIKGSCLESDVFENRKGAPNSCPRGPIIKILGLCIVCNLWFVYWDLVIPTKVYAANLSRAETLYLQRSYGDSIDECAKALSEGANRDFAYYLLGLNYLRLNDTEKAREKLLYLLDRFKASKYSDAARLAYADTFFLDQDYSKAKYSYETLLKQPGHLNSTLYLRLGQCALKTGNWQEARDYFNILKKNFPLSMEAVQADSLAQRGDYFFTVQAGCFANPVNAGRLSSKLKNRNFDAYIDEFNSSEGKLYRVRVGKLKSRREAENLKDALEKQGYPTRIFP